MRSPTVLALFALASLACGGEDAEPGESDLQPAPAAEAGPVDEDPGLPTESTEFRASPGAGTRNGAEVGGRLWVSTASTVEEDGFSLVAQLRNLPPEGAYSWAIHRGDCSAADDLLFGLGWGTVAEAEGRGPELANGGGPLSEMPLTFTPLRDGNAEETVFVPLGEGVTRAGLDGAPHSLRIHPDVDGDTPGSSVACAPIPPLPGPGEDDSAARRR